MVAEYGFTLGSSAFALSADFAGSKGDSSHRFGTNRRTMPRFQRQIGLIPVGFLFNFTSCLARGIGNLLSQPLPVFCRKGGFERVSTTIDLSLIPVIGSTAVDAFP
jgi:hypothetical protein